MKRKRLSENDKILAMLIVVALSFFAYILGGGAALAQIPSNCKNQCQGTYALCISATCDDDGNCGQGQKGDGKEGYCYVFKGASYACGAPCRDGGLYSTYSTELRETYGFENQTCNELPANYNCMDAKCERTGDEVSLKNTKTEEMDSVPTAICKCEKAKKASNEFQVLDKSPANCNLKWSTY